MMWLDHRAKLQAETINSTHHPVLHNLGGTISLEMQTPKLLWLKQVLLDIEHFESTTSSLMCLCLSVSFVLF